MAKRSRGSPRAVVRSAARERAFEQLVDRALETIPDPYRRALGEVAVIVDDQPSPAQLRENGIEPGDTMYGLYEGVPRTDYGADWAASPNRITLFRLPLQQDFPDPRDLEAS
jgi:predicted Zn-dependent protease with MMP-like domain